MELSDLYDFCNSNGISCRLARTGNYASPGGLKRKLNCKAKKYMIQVGGGKVFMKTFSTQHAAMQYLNDPANEVESTISVTSNGKGVDATFIVSDAKYQAYVDEVEATKRILDAQVAAANAEVDAVAKQLLEDSQWKALLPVTDTSAKKNKLKELRAMAKAIGMQGFTHMTYAGLVGELASKNSRALLAAKIAAITLPDGMIKYENTILCGDVVDVTETLEEATKICRSRSDCIGISLHSYIGVDSQPKDTSYIKFQMDHLGINDQVVRDKKDPLEDFIAKIAVNNIHYITARHRGPHKINTKRYVIHSTRSIVYAGHHSEMINGPSAGARILIGPLLETYIDQSFYNSSIIWGHNPYVTNLGNYVRDLGYMPKRSISDGVVVGHECFTLPNHRSRIMGVAANVSNSPYFTYNKSNGTFTNEVSGAVMQLPKELIPMLPDVPPAQSGTYKGEVMQLIAKRQKAEAQKLLMEAEKATKIMAAERADSDETYYDAKLPPISRQNREALARIKAIEESNGRLTVYTNIPDPRISGYYIYDLHHGYWYNRDKDVYLYYQEKESKTVASNLAKTGRFTPSQLENYRLFNFGKKPFDSLSNRLAFIESMTFNGFRIVDGVLAPVGTATINGEAYGVPKDAVMKHSFVFA